MNWKEHAHLFCKGKFKYKVMQRNPVTLTPYQFPKKEWFTNERANLRLIARKIEDMTDEEKMGLNHATGWTYNQKTWDEVLDDYIRGEEFNSSYFYDDKTRSEWEESLINHLCSKISGFLYLLRIGVYPFDQSHFEDGTVIDIKTLEKK